MAQSIDDQMDTLQTQVRRLDEALVRLEGDGDAALDEAIEASQNALMALWAIHAQLHLQAGYPPWRDSGSGPGWADDSVDWPGHDGGAHPGDTMAP